MRKQFNLLSIACASCVLFCPGKTLCDFISQTFKVHDKMVDIQGTAEMRDYHVIAVTYLIDFTTRYIVQKPLKYIILLRVHEAGI